MGKHTGPTPGPAELANMERLTAARGDLDKAINDLIVAHSLTFAELTFLLGYVLSARSGSVMAADSAPPAPNANGHRA